MTLPVRLGLAATALLSACGGSPRVTLPGFDAVSWVAALTLDGAGAVVAGSPVQRLEPGQGLDVFARPEGALVLAGWPDGALGPDPPGGEAIEPAPARCGPRLVPPAAAVTLDDPSDDEARPLDAAQLPRLTAPWAREACAIDSVERVALDVGCVDSPCPRSLTRSSRCAFSARVDCLGRSFDGAVDAAGEVCLTEAQPGVDGACTEVPAPAALAGRARCEGVRPCTIDALLTPRRPALTVERQVVREVPRYVPPEFLVSVEQRVRAAGRLVGWGFDLAVLGDRVVVASPADGARYLCADPAVRTRLDALALDTLTPLETAPGPACLTLLTSTGTSALALWLEGERYVLGTLTSDLRWSARAELDPRRSAAPGEPPLTRTSSCIHPVELLVDEAQVYVPVVRAGVCGRPGTTIHVLDRATLAPRLVLDVPEFTSFTALVDAGALWLPRSDGVVVERRPLDQLARAEAAELFEGYTSPIATFRDLVALDVDRARGELVMGVGRELPMMHRLSRPGRAAERARFAGLELSPVEIHAAPFVGEDGVVVGLARGDGGDSGWAAVVATYDRADFVVRGDAVSLGYGPPRRLLPDGRGGLLGLMMWEGVLVRIRPAR